MISRQDAYFVGDRNILADYNASPVVDPAIGIHHGIASYGQILGRIEGAAHENVASLFNVELHYIAVIPKPDPVARDMSDPMVAQVQSAF